MNEGERQVYVELNGYTIQTSLQAYRDYYKLIGWRILGRATELPLKVEPLHQRQLGLI